MSRRSGVLSPIVSLSRSRGVPTPPESPIAHIRKNEFSRTSPFSSPFKGRNRNQFAGTPSRFGRFSINEQNQTQFSTTYSPSQQYAMRSSDVQSEEMDEISLSFDLLKTMTPKNCIKYLSKSPLFLKTMVAEGKLDPDLVSSVSLSLTQSELQKFIQNMTQEMNFFNAFYSCETLQEVEQTMMKLIPMTRATIWLKAENADFVISPSLKTVLLMGKSIVSAPFAEGNDMIFGDPGDHPSFCIDNDLPLLRGCKSMMLLPMRDKEGMVRAIFQLVGFKDPVDDTQVPFTQYYIDAVKIIREIIQRKFFVTESNRYVPSNVTAIFGEVEKCSMTATLSQIGKFLQSGMPCEGVDIFEFDEKSKELTRLIDGEKFNEETGGISYKAALSPQIVNVPHGLAQETLKAPIDSKLSNKSVLCQSLFHCRRKFVITLRAKPNAPAFTTTDSRLLAALAPVICDAIKLAKWLEGLVKDVDQVKQRMKLMTIVNDAMNAVASNGCERWKAIKKASKEIFGSDNLFVAVFDGRNMKFTPSDVTCKFEDCTAGTAYNYRERVWGNPDDEKSRFNKELYSQLGIPDVLETVAFPYRTHGKVSGSIEIINPSDKNCSVEEQKLFSNLVACLLENSEENGKD